MEAMSDGFLVSGVMAESDDFELELLGFKLKFLGDFDGGVGRAIVH